MKLEDLMFEIIYCYCRICKALMEARSNGDYETCDKCIAEHKAECANWNKE